MSEDTPRHPDRHCRGPYARAFTEGCSCLDPADQRYVSLVSLLEIVIKRGTGKLLMTDAEFDETLADLGPDEMPIKRHHIQPLQPCRFFTAPLSTGC